MAASVTTTEPMLCPQTNSGRSGNRSRNIPPTDSKSAAKSVKLATCVRLPGNRP